MTAAPPPGLSQGSPRGLPAVPGGWAERAVGVPVSGGGTRAIRLHLPADPDAVLEEPGLLERCEADGSDPYWCTLWPVSVTLAGRALADPPASVGSGNAARVLELGCGAGLAGLAAASAGCDVTATDNQPRAVALAAANAALNGLPMTCGLLDWRDPPDARWDAVLGADLLYQPDLHAPLLDCLARVLAPGGTATLADPGRVACRAFLHAADAAGWRARLEDDAGRPLLSPRVAGHQIVILTRAF